MYSENSGSFVPGNFQEAGPRDGHSFCELTKFLRTDELLLNDERKKNNKNEHLKLFENS